MHARNKRVTFKHSFVLKGLEGLQPPGRYSVETHKVRRSVFSFLHAKRFSTWIRVCRNSGTNGVVQNFEIDPLDLAVSLSEDAAATASIISGLDQTRQSARRHQPPPKRQRNAGDRG